MKNLSMKSIHNILKEGGCLSAVTINGEPQYDRNRLHVCVLDNFGFLTGLEGYLPEQSSQPS